MPRGYRGYRPAQGFDNLTERNMIVDYRARVIHAGLIVSWVALLLFLFWVMSLDIFRDAGAVLGGFTAGLVILTLAP